jgi:hypothetical protein
VCVQCGYDLRTRKQLQTKVENPCFLVDIEVSRRRRVILALLLIGLVAVPSTVIAIGTLPEAKDASGHWVAWAIGNAAWATLWIMAWGTFRQLAIQREPDGTPVLYTIRNFMFLPLLHGPKLSLNNYDMAFYDYRQGLNGSGKTIFWLIMGCLILAGILPGVIFWFVWVRYVYSSDHYFIDLGRQAEKYNKSVRTRVFHGGEDGKNQFSQALRLVAPHIVTERA